MIEILRGRRLRPGDRVRLVSPASFPSESWAHQVADTIRGWGLVPELAEHALDRHGFLAGRDEDRLADLNDAFRDPGVRALRRSGLLTGLRGVAVGDLTGADPEVAEPGPDEALGVLRDRLGDLGVPILGGLPAGHVEDQAALPLGTMATIDTEAGTLTAESAVC